MKKTRMKRFLAVLSAAALAATMLTACGSGGGSSSGDGDTVKVGLLHSLTGSMAISEKSVRDAEVQQRLKSLLTARAFQLSSAAGLHRQERLLSLLLRNTAHFFGILFSMRVWKAHRISYTQAQRQTSRSFLLSTICLIRAIRNSSFSALTTFFQEQRT